MMTTEIRCPRCGEPFPKEEVDRDFAGMCPSCLGGLAREVADSPLKLGTTFHGYEILDIRGRGGMGIVYRARQVELGRIVALKVLSVSQPDFAERFHREAKTLAALDHPNIVRVIDSGREGDLFFFTMEYVEGVTLRDLIRGSRLPSKDVLAIIPQICDALEYAHAQGVVHRDIKPANILIDARGRVKIADFGLAKMQSTDVTAMTRTQDGMGTPYYMAPEQHANARDADHRADIYSLGVVFYEMLTGELPMGRFAPPSKRAEVDQRLDPVVLKAMERDPQLRYQRARHVRDDVDHITSVPAPAPARRRISPAWALLALVAIPIGWFWIRPEAAPSKPLPLAVPTARSPVGVNLYLESGNTGLAFKDLFLQSGPWISQPADDDSVWNDERPFAGFTPDGYPILNPGQGAGTVLGYGHRGHYPGGAYVCLFDGKGEVRLLLDGKVTRESPGRLEVQGVPSNDGVHLKIARSDPADPVRNIRFFRAEHESTLRSEPFQPEYLERLRPFGVLRFAGWQKAGESTLAEWKDRPKPEYRTQVGEHGVALEHMIALANELDADAWFCIPHLASDDFVRQFATMVRDGLEPGNGVYIEYSTQVWNRISAPAKHATRRGLALKLAADESGAATRFYSQRSVEIFRIWKEVLGPDRRLVRVLSTHVEDVEIGTMLMDWREACKEADALAVAPYFGIRATAQPYPDSKIEFLPSKIAPMTVTEVLDASDATIPEMLDLISENRANAERRGLRLLAYDGGQYLLADGETPDDRAASDLFVRANRDSGMEALYARFLKGWRKAGGTTFVHTFLSPEPYGSGGCWGMLEWLDQIRSPKWEAVLEFIHPKG